MFYFIGWLQKQHRTGDIQYFSTSMLNDSLSQFYVDIAMDSSVDHNMFGDIRNSIAVYIARYKQWTLDFTLSELSPSNIVLENLCQSYKDVETISKYKGSKKTPMTREDLRLLMSSSVFSYQSPIGLLRKVWYDLTVHLGVCGQDALRSIQDDSLIIETDEYGLRYCRLSPNVQSKGTRSRHEMQQWDWNARMYEISGDPNCPMASLNLYMSKRNPSNNAFFQRPKSVAYNQTIQWFDAPLGHCILARIMSKMSEEAALSKIYTNSTIRLTAATFLEEHGIGVLEVMHVHPRYKSTNQYGVDQKTSTELFNASYTLHEIMYNGYIRKLPNC
jgi:hypothetical protein